MQDHLCVSESFELKDGTKQSEQKKVCGYHVVEKLAYVYGYFRYGWVLLLSFEAQKRVCVGVGGRRVGVFIYYDLNKVRKGVGGTGGCWMCSPCADLGPSS